MTDYKELYKNVPHHGQIFIKNEKRCHWNFSNAKVGTVVREKRTAWRPLAAHSVFKPMGEPRVLSGYGKTPVQMGTIYNPGFYYDIDVYLECIEERLIPEGRITLWMDHAKLSGAAQQAIAFQCMSVDEYQATMEVQ